jgi:diacylglycerol kinase (ATP)
MLAISAVVAAIAVIYDVSTGTWATLLVCIGIVLTAELINTSIETLGDRVESDYDPAIRDTKDIAASAVLVISGIAAATGVVVLWPYIMK